MASFTASCLAMLVHLIFRISIFLEQPSLSFSSTPTICSWIHLASTFLILLDTKIYPEKYKVIPKVCQVFAESTIYLLLIEFSTVIIWSNLEKTFYMLLKYMLLECSSDMDLDETTEIILTIFSVFIFFNVILATGYYMIVKRKIIQISDKILRRLKAIFCNNQKETTNNTMTDSTNYLGMEENYESEDDYSDNEPLIIHKSNKRTNILSNKPKRK